MRKLLILPIVLIFATTGCQSLRRVEVWKQQTLFSPPATAQAVGAPAMMPVAPVAAPMMLESPPGEPAMQVEALMPGPVEDVPVGPLEDGPVL
jgi:hypothetical protein